MLDQLESHPTWYYRERINIDTKDGTVMSAFVYFNDTVDDTGVHHKTYTQQVSYDDYNTYEEEVDMDSCNCAKPILMEDNYLNEYYCDICYATISRIEVLSNN